MLEQKNAYARSLSGGMKRRLLVAKALVHNPQVVILDEPTAGVDVELRKKLWVYIKELNKSGVTVLLTTHYLHEAEELCDYISIINKGKIVISETRNNLLDLVKKKTVNFILEKKLEKIPNELNKYKIEVKNMQLSISYDKEKTNLKNILQELNNHNISFLEINTYESDLEDIFIELIKN